MDENNSKKVDFDVDDVVATDEEGNPLKKKASKPIADESDVVSEEDGEDSVKKLREKLKIAVEEKQKYLDGWQRDKADFLNARKRDEEKNREFLKFAKEDLVLELLPVMDSFEMAMANKEAWEKIDKNWRMGVEYIYSQLKSTLEKQGLKEINPVGQKYDPMTHDAVENVVVEDEKQSGSVISVFQKGYDLNGKVIRAPKVRVGEKKA